jgi:glycosyltransferase involved in cell wall biosynthesis
VIHVVLPPKHRGPACPFVQRTRALLKVLEGLEEPVMVVPSAEAYVPSPGDLVFFSYPEVHVLSPVPNVTHVECGVGYDTQPWGPLRVYESEAWRHYCFGKYGGSLDQRRNSWVIPWAFDSVAWTPGDGAGGYVSYLGRLMPDKGTTWLKELARRLPNIAFKVASTDDVCGLGRDVPTNVEFVGPILGEARSDFLGGASAHLCPSEFVEPLCGSAIEAMLCGTPVVCSNFGGFTESVIEGVSGFRCASLDEMIRALTTAHELDRRAVRAVTESRFGMVAAARRWKRALVQMRALA